MTARFIFILLAIAALGMQVTFFQTYSTAYFRIKYEKSVNISDIKKLGEELEHQYENLNKRFGITLNHRIDVFVYNSDIKFHSDSRSVIFDDGAVMNSQIYLMSPKKLEQEVGLKNVVARVVTRAVLDEIPFSPPWLRECYALYAGGDLSMFGDPARFKVSDFEDLSEEYSTAEREKDVKELYAKLAVTANFLINRYGEKKVEEVFAEFNSGGSLDEAFEKVFNEKIGDIEKAWMTELKNPPRE